MNPWMCAFLISISGALGGVVNALLTDNGFILPRKESTIWCPGFISNVLIGAVSAFSSWAFYGSGASVELAQLTERTQISLRFSALAGAFLVGVAGAKWITSEVDKQLLKESLTLCGLKTRRFFKTRLKGIVKYPPRRSKQLPSTKGIAIALT